MSNQMIATMITHGDLKIEMRASGEVFIVRQSDASAILLSLSEWNYLQAVADLHGWPIVAPSGPKGETMS